MDTLIDLSFFALVSVLLLNVAVMFQTLDIFNKIKNYFINYLQF